MDMEVLNSLPIGVSSEVFNAINIFTIPANSKTKPFYGGFTVVLDEIFPLKLEDGTIVDAVMLGSNGSKCFLIRREHDADRTS